MYIKRIISVKDLKRITLIAVISFQNIINLLKLQLSPTGLPG
jgi:hypothetical protein